jgi:hypothetical protein
VAAYTALGAVPVLLVALFVSGCGDTKELAPTASALTADEPASAASKPFAVDPKASTVGWVMDAPLEKIHGDLPAGLSGELFVDPTDLTKTTALVRADLDTIELFQQKRDDDKQEYGERVKNDTQNGHARTWLEISKDAPDDVRKKNAVSELKLTKLVTDTPDVSKLSGAERKVSGTLTGELLLHGRKLERSMRFEAVFAYEGDKLVKITVKTLEPMLVGLDEFDVKPRDAFGSLAKKTLGDLAGKVSSAAPVQVVLVATPK